MKKDVCSKCGIALNPDNWKPFLEKKNDYICVDCWQKRHRIYWAEYRKNPQKRKILNERSQKWAKDHPTIRKELNRNRVYKKHGISREEFGKLYNLQKGCCAICGKSQSKMTRFFDIDHNHITDKNRGLLCSKCNFLVGHIESNPDLVNSVLNYLKAWEMLEGQ